MYMRNIIILLFLAVLPFEGRAENLFATLLGKSEAEVNQRLDDIWHHFFTPADISRYEQDGEKSVYYTTADGMAFVMDTGSNDVRTEGMSYGMMISVQLGHRTEFDKLWAWAKRYMAYPAGSVWDGYFCWQCKPDGTPFGHSNASDGELYFVTALFLAAEKWNEPKYADEANAILEKVMSKGNGVTDGKVTVYNLFNTTNHIITFVPDQGGHGFTDPSYQLPAFLQKWSKVAAKNRDFWKEAAKAARNVLIASAHPVTGLYPDYCEFSGKAYRWPHAGYDTSIYMYDAIRCTMNVGMDYYLYGKDKRRQRDVMRRCLTTFKNDDFQHSFFPLDGTNAFGDGRYSQGMIGANAVGAFALAHSNSSDKALARELVQRLWDAQPPTGKYRYYQGMVYMLSMLHVSGHFKL